MPSSAASWPRIEAFSRGFSNEGHQVCLVTVASGRFRRTRFGRVPVLCVIPHVRVNRVTGPQLLVSVWNLFTGIFASMILFASYRPDVTILEATIPVEPLLGGAIASRMLGRRYVVDYQDFWERYTSSVAKSDAAKSMLGVIERFATNLYNGASKVVTVTPGFQKDLAKRGVSNLQLITNGADTDQFRPRDKVRARGKLVDVEERFLLVHIGVVGIYYRLDVVVEAMKILAEQGIVDLALLIAGGGRTTDVREVLSLAKKYGLGGRVLYFGPIEDRARVSKLVSAGDVGLVPLDSNPIWDDVYPTKFFEYAACGLPVVASVRPSSLLAEMVQRSRSGLVCEPLDPNGMAKCLRELYEDPELRESMGRGGREFVVRYFDLGKNYLRFRQAVLKAD